MGFTSVEGSGDGVGEWLLVGYHDGCWLCVVGKYKNEMEQVNGNGEEEIKKKEEKGESRGFVFENMSFWFPFFLLFLLF